MFNISDYLKKFVRIEGDSALQRDSIAIVLKEVCGIEGGKGEIRKGILYIKGSPMVKTVVYTKKGAVLEALRAKLPKTSLYDVR